MTLHTYNVEQRSPEWFDLRCGIVTASTVSTLLTPTLKVADNDTSRAFTAALVAERITRTTEPSFTNADMWRGIESEPFARDKYAEVNGVEVREVGFMIRDEGTWQLGYSPDGLVGDDGLIEVKSPRAKSHIRTILADRIPRQYLAQLQAGLFVTGRKWIDFISFHGGLPMYTKRVTPDPEWFAAIEAALVAFEANAEQMATDYLERAANLPATEPIDLEVVI